MTSREACDLLASTIIQTSQLRAENSELRTARESYRLLAVAAINELHTLQHENARLMARNRELLAEWRLALGFGTEQYWRDRQALDQDWAVDNGKSVAA